MDAGPASEPLYSSMRLVRGAPYGWKRHAGITSVLIKPILGWRGLCAFYREVSVGLCQNDEDWALTKRAVLIDGPLPLVSHSRWLAGTGSIGEHQIENSMEQECLPRRVFCVSSAPALVEG